MIERAGNKGRRILDQAISLARKAGFFRTGQEIVTQAPIRDLAPDDPDKRFVIDSLKSFDEMARILKPVLRDRTDLRTHDGRPQVADYERVVLVTGEQIQVIDPTIARERRFELVYDPNLTTCYHINSSLLMASRTGRTDRERAEVFTIAINDRTRTGITRQFFAALNPNPTPLTETYPEHPEFNTRYINNVNEDGQQAKEEFKASFAAHCPEFPLNSGLYEAIIRHLPQVGAHIEGSWNPKAKFPQGFYPDNEEGNIPKDLRMKTIFRLFEEYIILLRKVVEAEPKGLIAPASHI